MTGTIANKPDEKNAAPAVGAGGIDLFGEWIDTVETFRSHHGIDIPESAEDTAVIRKGDIGRILCEDISTIDPTACLVGKSIFFHAFIEWDEVTEWHSLYDFPNRALKAVAKMKTFVFPLVAFHSLITVGILEAKHCRWWTDMGMADTARVAAGHGLSFRFDKAEHPKNDVSKPAGLSIERMATVSDYEPPK